jgi:hypothetical protein
MPRQSTATAANSGVRAWKADPGAATSDTSASPEIAAVDATSTVAPQIGQTVAVAASKICPSMQRIK